METISINKLYLAALQLAYNCDVSVAAAAFYTSIKLVEQANSTRKRHQYLLWLIGGALIIDSMIWSSQLDTIQTLTILPIGLGITVLTVAIVAAFLVRRYSAASRVATSSANSVAQLQGSGAYKSVPLTCCESEQCYQLLAHNSTELISCHSPEGIYLYVSPACRVLLGYEPDELIGHSIYEFFHPQDLAALSKDHLNIFNQPHLATINYRICRRNGEYIWFESTPKFIHQSDTDVLEKIVIVSRDISDAYDQAALRKQAEAALQEREHQFQQLTANVPGIIYQLKLTTDGCMSFVFVSDGVREICELDSKLLQQNAAVVLELIYPDDHRSLKNSIAVSARTLKPWKWEGRFVIASGIKWLQADARPRLQANGDIIWDGIAVDITERKLAEAAWHDGEERLRAIFDQADVAIAQVEITGQFLRVNQKLCEITGYKREELLKKTFLDITYPEDAVASEVYQHQLLSGQMQTLNFEKRYLHKTGSFIWANVTVSLVRESRGSPKYFITVIEDITDRKQALEKLYRANCDRSNILESITEAFIAVDHDWRFTYINSKAEQILSKSQQQLLGKYVWDELPATVSPQLEAQFRQAVIKQESIKFEQFYPPLNIWFLVRAYPYEAGLSVYLTDITERKQGEAALLERSRLSSLAAQVGVALASSGTLLAILQLCTEALVQQLNATSAALWTLNPASGQLEQQAASGQRLPLKPDLINIVAQTRQPYLSSEQVEAAQSSRLPQCFSGYPLVMEERLIGVMSVLSNQPLTEEASRTLSWVANAIAVAIDRYWARAELLSRRESLLFELANQIRNSLELDTILETAVESIRSLLQIDRCHFLWYIPDENAPYWEVVNEARNLLVPSQIGKYTATQVGALALELFNQQIIQVDDVETFNDSAGQEFFHSLGYTSLLLLPIKTHAGKIGVICCAHCTGVRPWEDSEVELLQAVVAQLAIALDQAELYAQARHTAQVAQAQAQKLELTLNQLQATQAKLVQSEKMSSLGQLVAGIAHEINNPVNFIHGNIAYASAYMYEVMGLLRLYQEHYPNPVAPIAEQAEIINLDFIATDLPKLLASMQRGTDRIRSIVQSLRNFSRLDETRMKPVDLHEGIESTLMILQHRLKDKGQNPEIQVFKEYGNLPAVECYPGELNQVFMNIMINAIEALNPALVGIPEHPSLFLANPSPTITIRTCVCDSCDSDDLKKNSPSVIIRIADNGPGMTESVKARLFDPFFTTKPVGQGMGLGLSISYQIVVDHHHGVLSCTSAPGQGTEFWIEIPVQQSN